MWERTLTIGSAGKTFSVTGWKVREAGGMGSPPSTIVGGRGWPGNPERVWLGPQGPPPPPVFLVQVGRVLGPDRLMKHLRTVHQNSIYHCATQGQVRGRGHVRGGAG